MATTMHGIDISHWQSGLQLAKTDAQFAIMKATDGTSYVDAACNGFVNQAKSAGLLWGVYHFAQNEGYLNSEADHFVDSVRGYLGHSILVLDWEHGNLANVSGAKAWLDRVHSKTGIRPLIYMSQSVAASHNWSTVAKDYALWVARYGSSYGDTGAWAAPAMWQYTDAHHTGGMNVDGDHFYGDKAAWTAFATGTSSSSDDEKPAPAPDGPQISVDGVWGSSTTKRLQQVLGTQYKDGKVSRQAAVWRDDNPGLTSGWQWDGKSGDGGSPLIKAIQGKVGVTKDGKAGPDTFKAMQRHYDTPVDGVVSHPSTMVKEMQRRLNKGKF